jgi:hypothetical protein
MTQKGYYKNWVSNTKQVNLPQNVIWKPETEFNQALADVNQAIFQFNSTPNVAQIKLLRCLVLNSTPWQAIFGEPL